jgi:hypothetical protein
LCVGRESQRVGSQPSSFTQLQDYFGSAVVYSTDIFKELDIAYVLLGKVL